MATAAILDVDGTLVDTNYHHALAWYRAFREHDLEPPVWVIHRHVGMGGDQLVAAIAGDEVEERHGESIREVEKRLYGELIGEVRPFEGARELADGWTTSADVENTKPAPDLMTAALEKAGALSAVMVGDTVWDVKAAEQAEVKTIGVLTGGFAEAELLDAGAVAVFESPVALREGLDSTPLR